MSEQANVAAPATAGDIMRPPLTTVRQPMQELGAYTAFNERMIQRPAVYKVVERERSALQGSNAWDGPYYPQVRA